jgi:hypothetical protein
MGFVNVLSGETERIMRAVWEFLRWIEQLSCRLKGHDELMHFSPRRLSLHCTRCGYRSPGWEICPVRNGFVAGPGAARRPEAA